MIRTIALAVFGAVQLPGIAVAAACGGPTVTAVTVQSMNSTRYLNYYHVTATVTNRGDATQAGNVLQFIDVNQYGNRLDDRGVPPLAPGQSYTITYVWKRAVDAGKWTTPLDFRVRPVAPMAAGDCVASSSSITF
ncbi:MAG TPA: CARDB domain-containing protein [Candidatus Binatia bacterium]|nr:CARDB domain-containing protein [Candidatus Binatia bacterium]